MKATDSRHPLQPSPTPFDQGVEVGAQANTKVIYWHRDLPPSDAEYTGEHIIEAASARVASTVAPSDELCDRYYQNLTAQIRDRLEQEVLRLGGSYADVLDESIDSGRDDVTGERWLHGWSPTCSIVQRIAGEVRGTRETVTRMLSEFKNRHMVKLRRSSLSKAKSVRRCATRALAFPLSELTRRAFEKEPG
jgi:hypothetical protein